MLELADVAAPDASGDAVGRAVGDPQSAGLIPELDDADNPAEDFPLRDPHLVFDIRKRRRANEVAALGAPLPAGTRVAPS